MWIYNCCPNKGKLYNAITDGVIINDVYVNPAMFVNESNYYYIYLCVLLKQYRGQGYGTKLIGRVLEDHKNKEYCVLTISKAGYNLVKKYLTVKMKIDENISIFVKKEN